MRKDNPACYECPKHKYGMHDWSIRQDGTSICLQCKKELSVEDAKDMRSE